MQNIRNANATLLAVLLVVAVIALAMGCGSKEKAESTAGEKAAAGGEAKSSYGEQKAATSEETKTAVDWSAYSNPKAGVCPVCQMDLEPAYVTEMTIAEKKYALCSSRCATMLSENPDQYLSAAASTESHEGHTH
jgi:YHS domain-containing protein